MDALTWNVLVIKDIRSGHVELVDSFKSAMLANEKQAGLRASGAKAVIMSESILEWYNKLDNGLKYFTLCELSQ